jgi:hypothetical protein
MSATILRFSDQAPVEQGGNDGVSLRAADESSEPHSDQGASSLPATVTRAPERAADESSGPVADRLAAPTTGHIRSVAPSAGDTRRGANSDRIDGAPAGQHRGFSASEPAGDKGSEPIRVTSTEASHGSTVAAVIGDEPASAAGTATPAIDPAALSVDATVLLPPVDDECPDIPPFLRRVA